MRLDGKTVLITGASGGVSTAAIQICKLLGARVLAVTSGSENVGRVRDLGADVVFDRLETDFAEGVKAHTEGRGVDLVLDSVGAGALPDAGDYGDALWIEYGDSAAPARVLIDGGAPGTGNVSSMSSPRMFWLRLGPMTAVTWSRLEIKSSIGKLESTPPSTIVWLLRSSPR